MSTRTGTLLAALAIAAGAATSANADPLLSGYGGPGQGSQAILGASLIGGPPGGGTGEGGAGTGEGRASSAAQSAAAGGAGSSTPPATLSAHPHRGSRHGAGPGTGPARAEVSRTANGPLYPAHEASAGAPALGLSDSDLLYILLGVAALALTAGLTRQLVRDPRQGSG